MGEEQRVYELVGEEVSLWWGGQKRGRGYHMSCKEEEVELLCPPPSKVPTGLEQEGLLLYLVGL